MALKPDNTDPFGDGSLIAGYHLDGDTADYVGSTIGSSLLDGYMPAKFSDGASFANSSSNYINWGTQVFSGTASSSIFLYAWGEVGRIVTQYNAITSDRFFIRINADLTVSIFYGGSLVNTTAILNASEMNSIAIVANGSSIAVSINNSILEEMTIAYNFVTVANTFYAKAETSTDETYGGILDQIMIFNKALSASEITALNQMTETLNFKWLGMDVNSFEWKGQQVQSYYWNGDKVF